MKNIKLTLMLLFGACMILAGIVHFLNPNMYFPFIPDFLPKEAINYLTGSIEIIVGVGVFLPSYRSLATLGILVMMIAFLPLHLLDIFKADPAIGSHQAACIRFPFQFVLIFWAWFIHKK